MGEPSRIGARDLAIVLFVAIAWGGAFTAGHIGVKEISPYSLAAMRYVLAATLLLGILHAREGLPATLKKLDRKGLTAVIVLAVFGVVGYNVLLFAGLHRSTPINGSLFAATAPILTALMAVIVLREPLRLRQGIGMLISFAGLIVLLSHGSLDILLGFKFNSGDLLLLASMICFGAQSIAAKKAIAAKVTPWAATTLSCAIGALMLLPFLIYDLVTGGFGHPSGATWTAVIYLGSIATVLAYVAWYFLVGRHGAAPMSPFLNLVPVFGVTIGAMFGDAMVLAQAVAGVLVLIGVAIATFKRSAAAPSTSAAPVSVQRAR